METIIAKRVAPALGPYSHAITDNQLIFCSGQLPVGPDGSLVEGDLEAQLRRVFDNIAEVLAAAGSSLDHVLKTTVFMTDLGRFADMNRIYADYFPGRQPARTTVEVARLPLGASIEVEVIARTLVPTP